MNKWIKQHYFKWVYKKKKKNATGMIMLHIDFIVCMCISDFVYVSCTFPFQIESPKLNNYKSAGSQTSQKQNMIHNAKNLKNNTPFMN